MADRKIPLLGRIALQLKMIDQGQLREALEEQGRSPEKRLGEILVDKGFVGPSDLEHLAVVQKDLVEKHRARQAAQSQPEGGISQGESAPAAHPPAQAAAPALQDSGSHQGAPSHAGAGCEGRARQ